MQKFLVAKARNTLTGQTVKAQDLTGYRFTIHQRSIAQESADQLASNLSNRTKQQWVGFVEEYVPSTRG